jgi:hypothetical protein
MSTKYASLPPFAIAKYTGHIRADARFNVAKYFARMICAGIHDIPALSNLPMNSITTWQCFVRQRSSRTASKILVLVIISSTRLSVLGASSQRLCRSICNLIGVLQHLGDCAHVLLIQGMYLRRERRLLLFVNLQDNSLQGIQHSMTAAAIFPALDATIHS